MKHKDDYEYDHNIEVTPSRYVPEPADRSTFERKSKQRVLEQQYIGALQSTEITNIPTLDDLTSTLYEYDIAGPHVTGIGQPSGGYFREVAENEAAFAYILQDAVGLYLLKRMADNDGSFCIKELEGVINSSYGWMRIALLLKGGLIENVGSHLKVTSRGFTELNSILNFCNQKRSNSV